MINLWHNKNSFFAELLDNSGDILESKSKQIADISLTIIQNEDKLKLLLNNNDWSNIWNALESLSEKLPMINNLLKKGVLEEIIDRILHDSIVD